MDIFSGLLHGFQVALTANNLLMCVIGVVLGTVIGVLPGLGPPATIAIKADRHHSFEHGGRPERPMGAA